MDQTKTGFQITEDLVKKILALMDYGITEGMGVSEPGKMCVEALVCYAMGEPHSDRPSCVAPAVRNLKIALNDASAWKSNASRAAGLRRIAVAQLGTAGTIDETAFAEKVALIAIRLITPKALRLAAEHHPDSKHRAALEKAAKECEAIPGNLTTALSVIRSAASVASAAMLEVCSDTSAMSASRSAARLTAWSVASAGLSAMTTDSATISTTASATSAALLDVETELVFFAEQVVQVLVEMGTPGSKWLFLTENN